MKRALQQILSNIETLMDRCACDACKAKCFAAVIVLLPDLRQQLAAEQAYIERLKRYSRTAGAIIDNIIEFESLDYIDSEIWDAYNDACLQEGDLNREDIAHE